MKTIPFDLAKAKTPDNPNGLEVVDGYGNKHEIIRTNINHRYFPIATIRTYSDGAQSVCTYSGKGHYSEERRCNDPGNLLLVAPEPRHIEVWGFLYMAPNRKWQARTVTFPTREEAESDAQYYLSQGIQRVEIIKFYEYDEEDEQ